MRKSLIFPIIGVFLTLVFSMARAENTDSSETDAPKFVCTPSHGNEETNSCGEVKVSQATEDTEENKNKTMVGIPNPLQEITLKEFTDETGHYITLPENEFRDVKVIKVNVDPVLYRILFSYKDKKSYEFRMSKNSAGKDISGMYFNWTRNIEKDDWKISLTDSGQGIILWSEAGTQYCIIMTENATESALKKMRRRIIQSWELDE